jgi:hypothetical protein
MSRWIAGLVVAAGYAGLDASCDESIRVNAASPSWTIATYRRRISARRAGPGGSFSPQETRASIWQK